MKILLISSKYMPEYSGSGFRAHNLYKRLVAQYPDICLNVLSCSVEFNDCKEYEHDGLKVSRVACKPYPVGSKGGGVLNVFKNPVNFAAERRATLNYLDFLEGKPDLIHIFGESYVSAIVLDFAKKKKIPVLIELCNEMPDPWHYVPFPFSMVYSGRPGSPVAYVCISERLRKICLANGVPDRNIWCRPNPITEKIFSPVSSSEKLRLKENLTTFSPDSKLLVYVAKFKELKNHVFLLDVMHYLPDNFKLYLSGPLVEDGPDFGQNKNLYDRIGKRIVSQGLDHRVRLEHGFCEDIEKYYQMSDVYLFPTKAEGLGTPMLEAIACGVPVVANIIEGITDTWINDGRNGYLSSLYPKEFAEKIVRAASIPKNVLEEESRKILAVAGTSVIDAKYYEIMNTLCGR